MYVGRTRRPLPARVRSHRSARRAEWLWSCNEELARWLESNAPIAIVLDEVTEPGAEWEVERAWIRKYAADGLLNKMGNPLRPYKRRGGAGSPSAVAA